MTTAMVAQQKKYMTYKVKKGETLKGIAKTYEMSRKELRNLNPGVKNKPKENTMIVVPNLDYGKVKVVVVKPPKAKKNYTVKPKETLFGISRMFGVSIEDLKTLNPDLIDGLKIGMVLTIPEATITIPSDSLNYVLHTILKGDTMYNLSKLYEVGQDELLRLNPVLDEGFKLGTLIKIKSIEISEEENFEMFSEKLDVAKEINVVLMLPYQMDKLTDSILDESLGRSKSMLSIATDFHLGAMYAIDSLRMKGLTINIRYFDTENSNYKLQYILNKNDFSTTDVIVGPLFFEKALWVSQRVSTPVIAPLFSKKQNAFSENNLIKAAPNKEVYEQKLMRYFEATYKGENIVIINDEIIENQSKLWRVVNQLKAMDSIGGLEVIKTEEGHIDPEIFKLKLDTLGRNRVLVISDEPVTISAAINNLKVYAHNVDIDLFAYEKGKNWDKIDNEILGKMNFVFGTSEFLVGENTNVANFFKNYQDKNNAIPTNYAIKGFDIMYDLLVRLASDKSLNDGLNAGLSKRVLSIFNYDKKLFGSFENKGIFLVKYRPDLTYEMLE